MLELKILICELCCAIDVRRTRAIAVQKIASLDHEVLDLSINVVSHAFSFRIVNVPCILTTRWNFEPL